MKKYSIEQLHAMLADSADARLYRESQGTTVVPTTVNNSPVDVEIEEYYRGKLQVVGIRKARDLEAKEGIQNPSTQFRTLIISKIEEINGKNELVGEYFFNIFNKRHTKEWKLVEKEVQAIDELSDSLDQADQFELSVCKVIKLRFKLPYAIRDSKGELQKNNDGTYRGTDWTYVVVGENEDEQTVMRQKIRQLKKDFILSSDGKLNNKEDDTDNPPE